MSRAKTEYRYEKLTWPEINDAVDLKKVWVRTPIFVGDAAEIDAQADARIGTMTAPLKDLDRVGKRAVAPPSANAASGTLDLFYEIDNPQGKLSPGERVAVAVPLTSDAESLTAPWAAVVIDFQGSEWVYEQVGERTYARRRVSVRRVDGKTAVLTRGPAAGTKIVLDGAEELFGAETGFTK